jgi:hypothetical protein
MITFTEWRAMWGGQGLGDKKLADNGAPPPKNKIIPDKYKIPSISFFRYDQDRRGTKLDSGQ